MPLTSELLYFKPQSHILLSLKYEPVDRDTFRASNCFALPIQLHAIILIIFLKLWFFSVKSRSILSESLGWKKWPRASPVNVSWSILERLHPGHFLCLWYFFFWPHLYCLVKWASSNILWVECLTLLILNKGPYFILTICTLRAFLMSGSFSTSMENNGESLFIQHSSWVKALPTYK